MSLEFYRKTSILAADDFLGACYSSAMTPQKLWTLLFLQQSRRKAAGKRHFLATQLFNVALQFFACCSAAFGPNDIRTAERPMLQCNFCSATSVFACGMLQGWGLGV